MATHSNKSSTYRVFLPVFGRASRMAPRAGIVVTCRTYRVGPLYSLSRVCSRTLGKDVISAQVAKIIFLLGNSLALCRSTCPISAGVWGVSNAMRWLQPSVHEATTFKSTPQPPRPPRTRACRLWSAPSCHGRSVKWSDRAKVFSPCGRGGAFYQSPLCGRRHPLLRF